MHRPCCRRERTGWTLGHIKRVASNAVFRRYLWRCKFQRIELRRNLKHIAGIFGICVYIQRITRDDMRYPGMTDVFCNLLSQL